MFAPVALVRLPEAGWNATSGTGMRLFAVAGLFSHIAGRTALLGSAAHIGVSRAASFRVAAPVITVTFGLEVWNRAAGQNKTNFGTYFFGHAVLSVE